MIRRAALVVLLVAAALPVCASQDAQARAPEITRAEPPTIQLLIDTSGSMAEDDGTGLIKIEGARAAALNFISGLEPHARLGLRTYPAVGGDCDTGRLRLPIAQRNNGSMSAIVRTLRAGGDTPTGEALEAAADDLRASGAEHGSIVLISDGEHTCDRDPCDAAKQIVASGLQTEVITVGFQIDPGDAEDELRCIADATGGAYLSADDGDALNDVLDDLTRPDLRLSLDYPKSVVADVGVGPEGLVSVKASIKNVSQVGARNVKAHLRFDLNASPGVGTPVHYLGNVDGTRMVESTWSFRPGLILIGKTMNFTVIVSAANAANDIEVEGSISVRDGSRAEDAGPLLRKAKRVAILGDSYSSGEGSAAYTKDTDSATNRCHQSAETYLIPMLHLGAEEVIACSGAVTSHLTAPNADYGERAQVLQLRDLQRSAGPVDAVFLTLGGDDAGFSTIAKDCILSTTSCVEQVGGEPAETFLSDRVDPLPYALLGGYVAIDNVLNSPDAVRDRGHEAPIVVLAYPRVVPGDDRFCISLTTISQDELKFASHVVDRLNGTANAAVQAARQLGIPTYFVATSEDAFLPNHTVCDGKERSYARGIETFEGLRRLAKPPNLLEEIISWLGGKVGQAAVLLHRFYEAFKEHERDIQELFHPNQLGYLAMTRAVVRWSQTPSGIEAGSLKTRSRPQLDPGAIAEGQPTRLHAERGDVEVSAGGYYAVTADGYLPDSEVRVEIASAIRTLAITYADRAGKVRTSVAIPSSLDPGKHRIAFRGVDVDAEPRVTAIVVNVRHPPPSRLAFGFIGALALVAAGAPVLLRSRRRAQRGSSVT